MQSRNDYFCHCARCHKVKPLTYAQFLKLAEKLSTLNYAQFLKLAKTLEN